MALDSPIKLEILHAEHAPSPKSFSHVPSIFPSYFTEFTGILRPAARGFTTPSLLLASAYSFRLSSVSRLVPVI